MPNRSTRLDLHHLFGAVRQVNMGTMKICKPLLVTGLLCCASAGLNAAEQPPAYVTVAAHPSGTELGIGYVEVPGKVMVEPPMVEISPDRFGYGYRHGDNVYKEMAEHSFDNEPMLVVYPAVDPTLAPPPVVVVPASVDQQWIHVVAAQRVVDPIALGEDKIFLELSSPPEPLESEAPVQVTGKSKERRFFSTPMATKASQ